MSRQNERVHPDQAVLDELSQALTVETCSCCTFHPALILDAREKLTGVWLCPRIGRFTIDDAPKCRFYTPGRAIGQAAGGGRMVREVQFYRRLQ